MAIKLPGLKKVNIPSPSNIIKPISQPVQNIVPKTQTTLTNVVKPAVVPPVVNNVVKPVVNTKMSIQPVVKPVVNNVVKPVNNSVIKPAQSTLKNVVDTSKNVVNQVEKAIVNDTPNVFNQLFSSAKSWGDLIRDNPVVSMSAVGLMLMLV